MAQQAFFNPNQNFIKLSPTREEFRFYENENTTRVEPEPEKTGAWYSGIVDTIKEASGDAVEKLRDYVSAFAAKVHYWETVNTKGWPSDLINQKNILLATAKGIFNQIDKSGFEYERPDSMGFLPVIGAAAAGAILTAIVAWFKGSDNLDKRVALYDQQRTQGASHEQAIQTVNALAPASTFGGKLGTALGGTVGALIIGGGLLWFLTRDK